MNSAVYSGRKEKHSEDHGRKLSCAKILSISVHDAPSSDVAKITQLTIQLTIFQRKILCQTNKTLINISYYSFKKCTRKIIPVNGDTAALAFIH